MRKCWIGLRILLGALLLVIILQTVDAQVVIQSNNCYFDCNGNYLPMEEGSGYDTTCDVAIDYSLNDGISLDGRHDVKIENCKIFVYWRGIYMEDSYDNEILGNEIFSNNGAGIFIFRSNSNLVRENDIYSNYYGIYLDNSTHNTITQNEIYNNVIAGIYLFGVSEPNEITDNTIYGNEVGIKYGGNYKSQKQIGSSIVKNNTITGNKQGIHSTSKGLVIEENKLDNEEDVVIEKGVLSEINMPFVMLGLGIVVIVVLILFYIFIKSRWS